jgi:broad specificity phosphatase PhoE
MLNIYSDTVIASSKSEAIATAKLIASESGITDLQIISAKLIAPDTYSISFKTASKQNPLSYAIDWES